MYYYIFYYYFAGVMAAADDIALKILPALLSLLPVETDLLF